ncbi:MAG: type II toxin-antitoxin system VapC family toxin [Verrucomicrobiota bacterium]
MRYLIDTSVLIQAERDEFDFSEFLKPDDEVFICGATVAEFMAGEPFKDEGKRQRFRNFWQSLSIPAQPLTARVCERAGALLFFARTRGKTVPLGDGFHGAVADIEGLQVMTTDTAHFQDMGITAVNPLVKTASPPPIRPSAG